VLIERGSYCPRHQPVGFYERPSPSSRDRLPPHQRDAVKRERGAVCEECGQPGAPGDPLQVHHVRQVSEGGGHERGNLRVLHKSCHAREHRRKR
jgi:5-methylcytosine-specific restriction endonuclease McrA